MEQPVKEVEIFDITLLGVHPPSSRCGGHLFQGTYIRALASDLGEKLGQATLFTLKRTRHGEFSEGMGADIDCFKVDKTC